MTVGSEMPDYSDIMPHKVSFRKLLNNRVGEREHEILDEVRPFPGEMIINKTTTGAFNSSPIDSVLRAMGIEYCVFAGVSTDMCVEGTVRDAADRGYRVVLIEDGCAANRQEYHDASISAIQRSYGRVCTTDQVIRELAASVKVRST
jgi:nicotinamidase-related amidase